MATEITMLDVNGVPFLVDEVGSKEIRRLRAELELVRKAAELAQKVHESTLEELDRKHRYIVATKQQLAEVNAELKEWRSSELGQSMKRLVNENSALLEARKVAQEACLKANAARERVEALIEKWRKFYIGAHAYSVMRQCADELSQALKGEPHA